MLAPAAIEKRFIKVRRVQRLAVFLFAIVINQFKGRALSQCSE